MASYRVEVVTAEQRLFSGEARETYARSLEGEIGILPGHQPCLLALDVAPVKIVLTDGTVQRLAVHRGFLYYRGEELIILADMAELAEDSDAETLARRRAAGAAEPSTPEQAGAGVGDRTDPAAGR